jgi:hypothetical protein
LAYGGRVDAKSAIGFDYRKRRKKKALNRKVREVVAKFAKKIPLSAPCFAIFAAVLCALCG